MRTTKLVAQYLRSKKYTLQCIMIGTNLPKTVVYPSLGKNPRRALRADEFLAICAFVHVDPLIFAAKEE